MLRFADLVAAQAVRGKRVFIRADLNVPQDEAGRITEDTRIRASLPCIQMALGAGTAVMVTSHLGRPVPPVSNWIDGVGVFEFAAFANGSETLARAIAASPAFSIAGGGDTLAAIAKYGMQGGIGCISTGGGAFLEMLKGKTLSALAILRQRAREGAAT